MTGDEATYEQHGATYCIIIKYMSSRHPLSGLLSIIFFNRNECFLSKCAFYQIYKYKVAQKLLKIAKVAQKLPSTMCSSLHAYCIDLY